MMQKNDNFGRFLWGRVWKESNMSLNFIGNEIRASLLLVGKALVLWNMRKWKEFSFKVSFAENG
jgi:hypothetical protein